jgi:co-chaperonin GroES (HSP10)
MTQPCGKHILIQPDPVQETYESGLLKTTKGKSNSGVVIKMSPEYPFPLKVGDRVYYINTHQEEVDGCVLIRADAVLFKFNN